MKLRTAKVDTYRTFPICEDCDCEVYHLANMAKDSTPGSETAEHVCPQCMKYYTVPKAECAHIHYLYVSQSSKYTESFNTKFKGKVK